MKRIICLGAVLCLGVGCASAQNPASPLTFRSTQTGHVFAANSGTVTLQIPADIRVKSGEVLLLDETGAPQGKIAVPAGAHEVQISLPRKGYYALQASVSTGDGRMLTAVTHAGVVGPLPPEKERLASTLGMAKIQGAPELLAASGSGWTRGFTPQNGITANAQGEAQWWPAYKGAAPADKYNWVEAVMSPPAYTVAPEHQAKQSISTTYPPVDWTAYRKVARLFAASRPWVGYFEGLNEPDANHWRGTDEELVQYHRVMREEVHAAGHNQKVLGPCFWSIDLPHLQKLEKLGFLDAVDGISMHSYANSPPEGKWIEDIRALKAYLAKAGKPQMPIFLTEYGWGSGNGDNPSPEQELTQARYAARGVALLAAENLAASQYFVLRYAAKGDDQWSISRADNTPRPAYTAVSNAFRWLGNMQGRSLLHPTPTSYLLLFSKGVHTVAVGWDVQGTSRIIVPQKPIRVESMTGAPVNLGADDAVELTPSPVFLEFDSAALATPASGTTMTLTRGTFSPLTGAGKLALPNPLVVTDTALSAPLNATPGLYEGFQFLNNGWRTFRVQVNAPWALENLQVRWPVGSDAPAVEFDVRNLAENVTLLPYLKLENAPDEFGRSISLNKGESRHVSISIRNYVYGSLIRGTAVLEQRSAQGVSSLTLPFTNLPIVARPKAPDWESVRKLPSNQWRVFGLGEPKTLDPKDCSATLQTAYDSKGISLHVVVQDDVHAAGQGTEPLWAFDSVQFAFDLGGDPARRVLEYVATVREGKVIVWRFISSIPSLPQNVQETQVELKQTREGTETRYEIKLPWATLGLDAAPKAGQGIGFNLAINDSDGRPADRHGFEITRGIVANKDTTEFATLLLQ
jgi:hypothetical protein